MPSYQPPKYATAYILFVSLVDQSNTKLFKSSPTLASGDFKVSIDGGALANLATLPTNTPASSVMVKISLSAAEMMGDNITVVCIDAAGAEWASLVLNLQTTARQIDDLAYPATSGRSTAIDASGQVTVGTIATNAITAAAIATDAITAAKIADGAIDANTFASGALDAVWSVATRTLTAFGFSVTVGTNNDKTGYGLSAAAVQAIWDALTSALTTVGSIGKLLVDNINATISSRLASGSYTAPPTAVQVRSEIDSNSTQLSAIVADTNELQTDWVNGGRLDLLLDGVKAKTDLIPAAPADAILDELLSGHAISGSVGAALTAAGSAGDPWITPLPGSYGAGTAGYLIGNLPIPSPTAIAFTYTVTSTLGGTPIEGVYVLITTDSAGNNMVWAGYTDAFGVARDVNGNLPRLDAGVYFIFRQRSGYTFNDPDQETVS